MKFNDYQDKTNDTAIYPTDITIEFNREDSPVTEFVPIYPIVGLGEESGEVLGKIKKAIRDGHTYEQVRYNVRAELGDVLWYIARIAYHFNIPLEDVAHANLNKLDDRKERDVLHGAGDDR